MLAEIVDAAVGLRCARRRERLSDSEEPLAAAASAWCAPDPSTSTTNSSPPSLPDRVRLAQRTLEAHGGLAQHVVTRRGGRASR